MSFFSVVLIGIGLAMDAFAVSITSGTVIKTKMIKNAFRIGAFFGIFQAVMPLIGWYTGLQLKDFIVEVDHWVAFSLLSLIGIKMIYESISDGDGDEGFNPLNNKVLFVLAIATSIDAFAVGISFAFLDESITKSIIIIGFITFVLSTIGVLLGKKFGEIFKKKAEIVGGLVLILIGVKILLEHTL